MRQTFLGPLIEEVEAQLAREHGARYDRTTFENHIKGYSIRAADFRYTRWIDRRDPDAAPLAKELYDHCTDPHETVNRARAPQHAPLVKELAGQVRNVMRKVPAR